MSETGVVNIRGREYKTVARRVADFRSMPEYADYRLITEILSAADLVTVKATVFNGNGDIVATGHAEEERGSTNINKTSALENAETSAIGRCLAFLDGELAGTEIASAEEVMNAVTQQSVAEVADRHIRHMNAVKANWDSVLHIKQALASDDYAGAVEAYYELSEDDQRALALAPTKGGIWEVSEYKAFKSNEWAAARRDHFGLGDVA